MAGEIILTVRRGPLTGETYRFDSRDTCILGRSPDCRPCLPDDEAHQGISRYHCLFDISPPFMTVRDFGSLNGTFVNGVKIGQREDDLPAEQADTPSSREHEINDGDEILVGETLFEVKVTAGSEPEAQAKIELTSNPDDAGNDVSTSGASEQIDDDEPPVGTITTLDLVKAMLESEQSKDMPQISGFRFIRELGRGVSGVVYLVERKSNKQRYACKVLHPQVAVSQRSREEFEREVAILRRLEHPNIIGCHESGFKDGYFYVAMDYCDSGSVQEQMNECGSLALEEALSITLDVLEGLEYAHSVGQGIIHRDIKPANLFLHQGDAEYTSVRIGDFGLAKAFDMAGLYGCTMTGVIAGSLCFVPRWQIVNYKYTGPEADLWATAACCYYMITGHPPRIFTEAMDSVKTILETAAVPISERNVRVPAQVAEVIDQALIDTREPAFSTATEFKTALLAAIEIGNQ